MSIEMFCDLRDKIIMDPNYSDVEKVVLVDALQAQFYANA